MQHVQKYEKTYFMPPKVTYDWVKKEQIKTPPIWCSVDLRDGNQALVEPMSLEEKLEFFQMLVNIGLKEIEVGFPAASETEYQFMRALIERDMIPEDVTVQVLTQAREHIIRRTFEAVKGAPHAVIHLYNSTSVAQREQVFRKSKEEIKEIAVQGAKLLKDLAKETEGSFTFEYSPESFSGTEVEYAVEVCNAVLDVWRPDLTKPAIINIPTTVENAIPHVFACQMEYVHKHLKYRDHVVLSLHPHNDRGCAVATAELGILAGADRIEGTLFGNGERTGNVDLVTLAMNLYSHGIDPGLDFSDIRMIRENYEKFTGMHVYERQPYAGDLVFTAFSGSHQDAIAKGMVCREESKSEKWTVPYLPIDPRDVGRKYDSDVIRINSQSGKGGVNYILKQSYGINLPKAMREEVGYLIKDVSDKAHQELSPEWIYQIFEEHYISAKPVFHVIDCEFESGNGMTAHVTIHHDGSVKKITAAGNGRLDAISNAFKQYFGVAYELTFYEEHSLTKGSASKAVAYVAITYQGKLFWGTGIDSDIIKASEAALTVAVNKISGIAGKEISQDARMNEMMNYIRANYKKVSLDSLSERFFLSKPYISKYIREKSGSTFGELVRELRMDQAKAMLRESNMTVESISGSVGYQNVEHFNRLFRREFHMTPIQYRNERSRVKPK